MEEVLAGICTVLLLIYSALLFGLAIFGNLDEGQSTTGEGE